MLSFGVIIYFMLSFNVIIFDVIIWCYHLVLSFDVIISHSLQMLSFLCYHFSLYRMGLSFMLSFNVIIFCYHFPPFFFFLKTWHTPKKPKWRLMRQKETDRFFVNYIFHKYCTVPGTSLIFQGSVFIIDHHFDSTRMNCTLIISEHAETEGPAKNQHV